MRAMKGHLTDFSVLTFKEGDSLKLAFHAQTTDKVLVFTTGQIAARTGRAEMAQTLANHTLAGLLGSWVRGRPPLSVDVGAEFLVPALKRTGRVVFIVIDCLRLEKSSPATRNPACRVCDAK